ncbi:MAG: lamin tail domain-containing protein [Acidobacteria bacterium]|nr:lamin tail domain-containing protein [Acidobacteriota bacterium]
MGIKSLVKWTGILVIVLAVLIPLTAEADIGIVFSEILYDSDDNGDTQGEWLEIYNSTSADVNVGGWKIQDNTDTFTIPSCTIIGAGGYLILAQDRSYFYNKYGFYPNIDNSTLRLHNDGDFVTLKDKEGNIKDQVAWESGGSEVPGWSSYTLPYAYTGKSIVRYNLAQDTNTYVDWRNNQDPSPFSNTLPPGKPAISLNPTKLDFSIITGGSAPAQTFAITNSGCGTLNWTLKESAGWLSCTPLSGTGPGTVTVTIDAGGLVPGTYNTTITVSDANATNSPQTLAVKLIISNAAPKIEVNPTSFSFTAECDGPSQSKTFTVGNAGSDRLRFHGRYCISRCV